MRRHPAFRTFDEAFAWLAARTNYETMATQRYDARTYGLDRVRHLLDDVGRPDRAFDVVQVVGSKGKGSTSACLASILRASGRRTGLYMSPHLVDPRERITVDGRFAPDRLVVAALARLVPLVDAAQARGEPLTFFEIHTVAALMTFRAARCGAVVLEAGMGGRLDATTAADAKCVVLTSVSLDHTAQLGRTRKAIAREKAAAARKGVPFVSGVDVQDPVATTVAAVAERTGARTLVWGRDFRLETITVWPAPQLGIEMPTSFELATSKRPAVRLDVALFGPHQAGNAALAAVAARETSWTGKAVPWSAIRRGLHDVRIRARLDFLPTPPASFVPPGRFTCEEERLAPDRGDRVLARTVVDGAHNPDSFGTLKLALAGPGSRRRFAVVVLGMAADKDIAGSLRRLRGFAKLVIATTSGQARAEAPQRVARLARDAGLAAIHRPDLAAALREAYRRAGPRDLVVITGSLYLCGAALRLWGENAPGYSPRPHRGRRRNAT